MNQVKICLPWSHEAVQYKNADWTWGDCELVTEICETWGTTKFPWFMANWRWSECSGSIPPVPVVNVSNQPGVDAMTLVQPWIEEPWNPYRAADREQAEKKRKRLIKLICKIKNESYSEEKIRGDYKVTVGDIRMVVKAMSGVELKINEKYV